MEKNQFKIGIYVYDTWQPNNGVGIVADIKKTFIKVKFNDELIKYDYAHAKRFLSKCIIIKSDAISTKTGFFAEYNSTWKFTKQLTNKSLVYVTADKTKHKETTIFNPEKNDIFNCSGKNYIIKKVKWIKND